MLFVFCCLILAVLGSTAPGSRFDLSDWYLQLPVAQGNGVKSIKQPELATYSSEYFSLASDNSITFMVPTNGATTSGSKYPRSELRETYGGQQTGTWVLSSHSGIHVLKGRVAVPSCATSNSKVSVAQVKPSTASTPVLLELLWIAGKIQAMYSIGNEQTPEYKRHDFSVNVGSSAFDYTVLIENKILKIIIAGEVFSDTIALWDGEPLYFKAGDYVQSNTGSVKCTVSYFELCAKHGVTTCSTPLTGSPVPVSQPVPVPQPVPKPVPVPKAVPVPKPVPVPVPKPVPVPVPKPVSAPVTLPIPQQSCSEWKIATMTGYDLQESSNPSCLNDICGITKSFLRDHPVASILSSDWNSLKYHSIEIKRSDGATGLAQIWDFCRNEDCPDQTNDPTCCTTKANAFGGNFLVDLERRAIKELFGISKYEDTLEQVTFRICGVFDPQSVILQGGRIQGEEATSTTIQPWVWALVALGVVAGIGFLILIGMLLKPAPPETV